MAKLNIKNAIGEKTKQALNNSYITSEQIKQNITILEELRNFIPSPTAEELAQLEDNIIKNGCKDALLLWETTQKSINEKAPNPDAPAYVLVDGHNRFRICTKRNINFNVQLMSFPSIKEVKDYMIDLQLGRRNLNPQQASYFRGLRYNNEKSDKGKYERNEHKSQNDTYEKIAIKNHKSQNDTYDELIENELSTSEKLANEYKVSRATIMRDAEYSKGLEQLSPTLKNAVLNGEIKIGKSDIQKISKQTNKKLVESIEELEQLVKENSDMVITESKSAKTAQKQLMITMAKMLNSKNISLKELDKLIAIAHELKQLL